MIIYPAIDLKDGKCVRLEQGDMNRATIFNESPAEQARAFAHAGAEWIHIVDLNGAFAGRSVNTDAVTAIVDAVDIPVQLGGGIRDEETIEFWLNRGVSRVILGTVTVKNPSLVRRACSRWSSRIVLGIDAIEGRAAVEGWAEVSNITSEELAKDFEEAGAAAIIYTDISRDGLLKGPNIDSTMKLAKCVATPIIASGGISGIEDIRRICASPPISGVIVGRALYDKKIVLETALEIVSQEADGAKLA